MNKGIFVIVLGPTGSGKSTLMKHAMSEMSDITVPFSYTTRAPRAESIENNHYQFLTREAFQEKVDAGEFLEWAEYGGNLYGTLKSEIEQDLAEGKLLLKEMEVQGVRQVLSKLPRENVYTVYVSAGSWETLAARVKARAPITDEELALRHKRFLDEETFMPEADAVIENGDGEKEEALNAFTALLASKR